MKKQFPKSLNKSFRLKTTQESAQKISGKHQFDRMNTNKAQLAKKTNAANLSIPSLTSNSMGDQKSNYFHPDIYLKPEQRKKYFCHLVDSYMKNRTGKEDKTLYLKKKSKEDYQIPPNYDIESSKFCNEQVNSQSNSPENSPMRKVKLKRAMTAGYAREKSQEPAIKLQKVTNYNDDATKVQKSTVFVTPNKQLQRQRNQEYSKTIDADPQNSNPKLRYLNKILKLKNQINNVKRYKNSELSPETQKSKKNYNQADLNNSLSNQSLSQPSDGEQTEKKDHKNQTKQTADFSGVNKVSKKIMNKHSMSKSRIKTLSQNSLSNSTLKINKRKHQKTVRLDQLEGREQELKAFQIQLRDKLLKFSPEYKKEWKIKYVYQHELFEVFYLYQNIKSESGLNANDLEKQRLKVKKFDSNQISHKLKNTIEKVKQIGVSQMWTKLPKAEFQQKQVEEVYLSRNTKPLRQQLFNFIKQQKSSNETDLVYSIHPKSAYYDLFHNNCEQFRDIIVCVAENLQKMDGKLISNKMSLDNIYRLEQKCIKIGDWGCSALSRTIIVAGKSVNFKDEPTLTYEFVEEQQKDHFANKWLLEPQNLAPEVVSCLIGGSYNDVWQIQSCPQVWSLGIIILELLTFIPVWMPYKSIVNHGIPKRGFIHDKLKRLNQIYSQQLKIPILVSKWIRQEKGSQFYRNIHPEIINLMKSMLQINTKLRPKPIEIITKLKNVI